MSLLTHGGLPTVEWLDPLTHDAIRLVKEREKSPDTSYLLVELPQFDAPVFFSEPVLDRPALFSARPTLDPEMLFKDNLVENKHHKMTRSKRRGPLDRDLKPDLQTRDTFKQLLRRPPGETISTHDRDLLWRFRFYLSRDRRALPKFLRCIDWAAPADARQAVELLETWDPATVDDALELLGKEFGSRVVREYAVQRLAAASDEELLLYLLQLVQSLKNEGVTADIEHLVPQAEADQAPLERFLLQRAVSNKILTNYLYWYIYVEQKSEKSSTLPTRYAQININLYQALTQRGPEHAAIADDLSNQKALMKSLLQLSQKLRDSNLPRPKRIELLRQTITETSLREFPPVSLPLDPSVRVVGIRPATAHVFKSAMMPLGLDFETEGGGTYSVIYKNGDDLRQDQLVVQMIRLIDRLLKKENLDLKLTPYHVLATSPTSGMVQKVEAKAVAEILDEEGSIQNYFRKQNPLNDGTIQKDVLDTYVRSCAGYCVITYILGVGDRHLDNLMLCRDGRLFHIDFGFILGRDPKPYPPPFKLSRDMVEGMGGEASDEMRRFRSHCYSAYLILRKHAGLIVNLFALMIDSNVQDIALDPDKTAGKVSEKLRLDLSDELAVQSFGNLIDESVSALFAQLVEKVHKWAQYWRK
eukprot:m.115717 g.115717  ORF g.115717 m.115717 type:complete len:643 (+) comp14452_c18_seq2:335-2263(+)